MAIVLVVCCSIESELKWSFKHGFYLQPLAFFSLVVCNGVLFYMLRFSSPGSLKPEPVVVQDVEDGLPPVEVCEHCGVRQSPTTKHCKYCGICVPRYDHHCIWVNNCIGQGNHALFWWYLLFQTIAVILAFHYCITAVRINGTTFQEQVVVWIMLWILFSCLLCIGSLFVFHTVLAVAGRTTREFCGKVIYDTHEKVDYVHNIFLFFCGIDISCKHLAFLSHFIDNQYYSCC